MSKTNGMKNKVEESIKKPKEKRFSISKEDREKLDKLQAVAYSLKIQHDGIMDSIYIELERIKMRLSVMSGVPEGVERVVTFDKKNNQLVALDFVKNDVKRAKEEVKKEEEETKLATKN